MVTRKKNRRSPLTVGRAIRRVLPDGTGPTSTNRNGKRQTQSLGPKSKLAQAPYFPPDLFAVTLYLLELAGAYHFFQPYGVTARPHRRSVLLRRTEIEHWRQLGKQWRKSPKTPKPVISLWRRLWDSRDGQVYVEGGLNKEPPEWWKLAYGLMVIADEACQGVGFHSQGTDWISNLLSRTSEEWVADKTLPAHLTYSRYCMSIGLMVDRDVICVQPKALTPDVGCTPRTLAFNLAVLPARGEMAATWQLPPQVQLAEEKAALNLLLVPYPYKMQAAWFQSFSISSPGSDWGLFTVKQNWLPAQDRLVEFTIALLDEAMRRGGLVHGIVFPEFSLNWATYEALAEKIKNERPEIEFLVAGSSTDHLGQNGNWALSSHFFKGDDGKSSVAHLDRPKHHRWRLDAHQIENYDLSDAFGKAKEKFWIERIPLPQRVIHVQPMRSKSVFTTMICEDLARSDPCHESLRSIGPNLVIVLLMDGPQLKTRWPARYATALGDDPGCSVLTLTSRALVHRSNEKRKGSENWSIALWKDNFRPSIELPCPPGQHALLLKLRGRSVTQRTIHDSTSGAFSWTLSSENAVGSIESISLDAAKYGGLIEDLGAK
jgi:hypothetical protein